MFFFLSLVLRYYFWPRLEQVIEFYVSLDRNVGSVRMSAIFSPIDLYLEIDLSLWLDFSGHEEAYVIDARNDSGSRNVLHDEKLKDATTIERNSSHIICECYYILISPYTRGIQKVLRQILNNTLFMKFTKLFLYIVSIQFITLLFPLKNSRTEFFYGNIAYGSVMNWMETM